MDRATFAAWARSPQGQSLLAPLAARMRLALFGRTRAARRHVWRLLTRAARREAVVACVQREADGYLGRLDTLVHARELPRVGIDLHRLVVVPRVFANGEVYRRIEAALTHQRVFAELDNGNVLRDWFVQTLVGDIASAVAAAEASPRRPLPAGDSWIVVGVNQRFEWRVPFQGIEWPGHYYVLELTRAPITRALRRTAAEEIARLEASLPSLSKLRRSEILRRAGTSLHELFASA